MNMHYFMIGPPLISLCAGIAIIIWPNIVAFYLILFGLIGLLPVMFA